MALVRSTHATASGKKRMLRQVKNRRGAFQHVVWGDAWVMNMYYVEFFGIKGPCSKISHDMRSGEE